MTPLMRLQDPAYTRIVLVTLPEITPVSEARRCRTTCAGRGSSRSPGWSIAAWPPRERRDPVLAAQVGR